MTRIEFDFNDHFATPFGISSIKREVSALNAMALAIEKLLEPAAKQVKLWWENKVERLTFKLGRQGTSYVTDVTVEIKIDADITITSKFSLADVDVSEGKVQPEHVIINILKACSGHFLDEHVEQK